MPVGASRIEEQLLPARERVVASDEVPARLSLEPWEAQAVKPVEVANGVDTVATDAVGVAKALLEGRLVGLAIATASLRFVGEGVHHVAAGLHDGVSSATEEERRHGEKRTNESGFEAHGARTLALDTVRGSAATVALPDRAHCLKMP